MLASPDCSPMRSSRPSSLSACSRTSSGMPASSILVRYSSTTLAPSSPSSRWIDSICLRRKYSRCCLSAPDWTSSRMRRRTCSSVRRSRWMRTASASRSVTSTVSRTSTFSSKRDVGRVADRVGQSAGLGDGAQERADALVGAARLEDLLDDGAVLALELAGAPVDRDGVGGLLDLDAEMAEGIVGGGAGNAAHLAGEGHGASAAGQPHALGDARDRPDLGELRAMTGDEQNALVVADVHGQRHVHRREHDRVVEGDEQKLGHAGLPFHSHLRIVCIVDAGRCMHKDLGPRS